MKILALIAALSIPAVAQQAVQLAWSPSSTAGTSVRVYRAATCAGPFVLVAQNQPAAGPFNTVIPNIPGSSVSFQVTATLGNLESTPSNCAIVTVPNPPVATPPSAPTSLTVTIPQ